MVLRVDISKVGPYEVESYTITNEAYLQVWHLSNDA